MYFKRKVKKKNIGHVLLKHPCTEPSVCLSTLLSACLPACLFVSLHVCLPNCHLLWQRANTRNISLETIYSGQFMFINSVDNSKLLCLTVCLPACLPNCLLVCLSVLPTVQLSLGSGTLNFLSLNFCISPLLLFLEFIFKCNTTIPLCLSPKTLWRWGNHFTESALYCTTTSGIPSARKGTGTQIMAGKIQCDPNRSQQVWSSD